VLGHAGELHPAVLARLGLPASGRAPRSSTSTSSPAASAAPTRMRAFSTRMPLALTDVALTVDEAVTAGAVEARLRSAAGELLESVALFDVYRGEQVGPGKKSLAFRLSFRAPDRTLTTGEVSGFRDAAVAAVAQEFDAVQR
jgi:phenylalanyl-tRNA synthetase beta chain